MTSLRDKTIKSVVWNTAESLSKRGVGFVVTLLLARFLTPDDFGLIAVLSVVITIASSIMESGFRQALIRKKDATPADYTTVFYTNIVLGIFAYVILFFSANLIADFYNEARLASLVRYVGIVIVINSFSVVQYALLCRRIDFRSQMSATLPAVILSGAIAVIMAFGGLGVTALVAQMLFNALFTTILLWRMSAWKPSITFSASAFREMFGFGWKLFVSGLIDLAFKNIYVIVIGKLFTAQMTGYYFFAQRIQDMVVGQLTGAIQNVTYPVFASIQDDSERMLFAYRKVVQVTTYIVFPTMVLLAVLAKEVFYLVLGQKWLPAVPYLQLLCFVGMLYPLHSINLNILKVKGRSDLFLRLEIIKKILVVIGLAASVRFGIEGIIVGQLVFSVLAYAPNSYYSMKLIGYGPLQQLRDFSPALLLALVVGILTRLIVLKLQCGDLIKVWFSGTVGIVSYVGIAHMLKLLPHQLLLSIVTETKLRTR